MLTRQVDEKAILQKIERHFAIYEIAKFLSYVKTENFRFKNLKSDINHHTLYCAEGRLIELENYDIKYIRSQLLTQDFSGEDQKYVNICLFLLAQYWPRNRTDDEGNYVCAFYEKRKLDLNNRLLLATGTQIHKISLRYFDHAIDEYQLNVDPMNSRISLNEDHKALLRPEFRKLNNFFKNPQSSAGQTAGMLIGFVCLISVSTCMLMLVPAIASLTPLLAVLAGVGIGLASAYCVYRFFERVVTYLKPYRSLEMYDLVNMHIAVINNVAKQRLEPEIEKEKKELAEVIRREQFVMEHRQKLIAARNARIEANEAEHEAREAKENPGLVAKRYADALHKSSLAQRSIWSDTGEIEKAMEEEVKILKKMSPTS